MALDMEIQWDESLHVPQKEEFQVKLTEAAEGALRAAGRQGPAGMTLLITDDEQIRELNRRYRHVDATTDVLAFAFLEEGQGAFVAPAEEEPYLGDVIISLPQAERQAEAGGHSLLCELCLLAVHGTLHLLGHDHAEPAEKARMWALQRAVLADIGCEEAAPPEVDDA